MESTERRNHWQPEKATTVLTFVVVPGVTVIELTVAGLGTDEVQLGASAVKLKLTGAAAGAA
jgi:hypothetical protein